MKLTDFSVKKTFLFNIDDTFIGDNPYVKVVIYPDEERIQPKKKEKSIENE